MKLIVEGDISATSYKTLISKLKTYSKKDMLEIFDSFLFHKVLTDENARALINYLEKKEKEEQQKKTSKVAAAWTEGEEEEDSFFQSDPRKRFRPPFIDTLPTEETLSSMKDQLDLMYDFTCFDCYIEPVIRAEVASKLIEFATANGIPVQEHWIDFSQEQVEATEE